MFAVDFCLKVITMDKVYNTVKIIIVDMIITVDTVNAENSWKT